MYSRLGYTLRPIMDRSDEEAVHKAIEKYCQSVSKPHEVLEKAFGKKQRYYLQAFFGHWCKI